MTDRSHLNHPSGIPNGLVFGWEWVDIWCKNAEFKKVLSSLNVQNGTLNVQKRTL
jgi:hypothetical protein